MLQENIPDIFITLRTFVPPELRQKQISGFCRLTGCQKADNNQEEAWLPLISYWNKLKEGKMFTSGTSYEIHTNDQRQW